jgi:type II secretory pathway pseudopilin PulG
MVSGGDSLTALLIVLALLLLVLVTLLLWAVGTAQRQGAEQLCQQRQEHRRQQARARHRSSPWTERMVSNNQCGQTEPEG